MKLQDLTIDQFQRLAAIELSPALNDFDKRMAVIAIADGVELGKVREMPATGLSKRYNEIVKEWNELPTFAVSLPG